MLSSLKCFGWCDKTSLEPKVWYFMIMIKKYHYWTKVIFLKLFRGMGIEIDKVELSVLKYASKTENDFYRCLKRNICLYVRLKQLNLLVDTW